MPLDMEEQVGRKRTAESIITLGGSMNKIMIEQRISRFRFKRNAADPHNRDGRKRPPGFL